MKVRKNPDSDAASREEAETYYAEIRDDQNFASSNLSTQIRTTVLAILALTWLLLSGTESTLNTKFGCFSNSLMWLAAVCIVVLLSDFLQGVCAVREASEAANKSADALSDKRYDDVGYEEKSALREASTAFYIVKCILVVVSAAWLVGLIFRALSGACIAGCG